MAEIIQDLFTEDANPQHKLGGYYVDPWGDKFRYVQNGGASALVTGHLLQEPAEDTNYRSMVVQAAAAIGATEISVTLGGTAVTANQFESGRLWIESGPGIGQSFRIVRHEVQTSTTGTCKFVVDRQIKIALTTASQASVRKSPFDGVISNPTVQTGSPVGVALYAMTIDYYGWIQSGGDVAVLFDTGTNTSNGVMGLGPSAAVAGSVKPQGGGEGALIIGYAREVGSVDSTMGIAHLTID